MSEAIDMTAWDVFRVHRVSRLRCYCEAQRNGGIEGTWVPCTPCQAQRELTRRLMRGRRI